MKLTPRTHNVISYGVSWLLLPVAALLFASRVFTDGLPENAGPPFLLPMCLWCVHFARRANEALMMHRYGKQSFPWSDALIEYAYYWGFAVWIAYALVQRAAQGPELDLLGLAGLVLFCLAELGNARSHWILRELRSVDATKRAIPRGFLFKWLSCPHYLCEILSWVGFALVARSVASAVFAGVGAAILVTWATLRHRAYLKDFDGQSGRELYPARRKAIFPYVY